MSWLPVAKTAMAGAASLRKKKERYEVPATSGIVTSDLKVWLDFSRPASYPGTGAAIYDLSGQGNTFTLVGTGYIHQSPKLTLTQSTPTYATGPASNVFGITTDHTIEIICRPTAVKDTILFQFLDSTKVNKMSQGHVPWSDGRVYYDVRGCCEAGQRLGYIASAPTATVKQYVFRTRSSAAPQRQIFENGASVADSAAAATSALYAWGGPTTLFAGNMGASPWSGDVYAVRIYNRALTDAEIAQNYAVVAPQFGLVPLPPAATLPALPLTLPIVPGTPLTAEQLASQIQYNRQLQLLEQQRMFGAAFNPNFGQAMQTPVAVPKKAPVKRRAPVKKKKKKVVYEESDDDETDDDETDDDDESDEDSEDETESDEDDA